MKALHVISGISQQSGGPARSSQGLVAAERAAGVDALIYTFDRSVPWIDGVVALKTSGDKLLAGEARQFDLVHIHGIWDPRLHDICVICRAAGVPYVIAPRGMLEPWSLKQKWLKKWIARFLYQDKDLKSAAALHATAKSEAEHFRKLGFKNKIIDSPNGVDLPAMMPPRTTRKDGKKTILFLSRIHPKKGLMELVEAWARIRSSKVRVSETANGELSRQDAKAQRASEPLSQAADRLDLGTSVGRRDGTLAHLNLVDPGRRPIEPEIPSHELSSWHIEYAGPDYGGHLREVQKKIRDLGVGEDFTYLGDLSDVEKWHAYRRADIFVLPTYSENFGIVVAEALAAGIPVITTKGTPWAELLGHEGSNALRAGSKVPSVSGHDQSGSHVGANSSFIFHPSSLADNGRCGWWTDIGIDPLAEALCEATGLSDEERFAMGENGRKLVEAKYTWPAIAEQMKAAYAWILNGGEVPPSVMLE